MKKNLNKLFALFFATVMLLGLTNAVYAQGENEEVLGKYNCIAIAYDGTSFTAPESENSWIELEKDGEGTIFEEFDLALQWELDGETFHGSYIIFDMSVPLDGTLKDGILEIRDDTVVMRYLKEGLELPDWAKNLEAAPGDEETEDGTALLTEEEDSLLDWWNGDWYGWWGMHECTGDFEDLENESWDCEAHIEIGSDYTGKMEMWDQTMPRNGGGVAQVDVSLCDSGTGEHGSMILEDGWFLDETLTHADRLIDSGVSEYENMLEITGKCEDGNGNGYSYKVMLRPWGQLWEDVKDEELRPWTYEYWYKPMIQDGVTKMSTRFGDYDQSVYDDLEKQKMGNSNAEESDGLTGTWTGDLGGDGIVTWTFEGNGSCTMENFAMKQTGTYSVDGDQMTVQLENWDAAKIYTFSVDDASLNMEDNEGIGISGTYTRQ